MRSLEGKIAVITGGNSGIGKATARRFAEEGAQVLITGRRQDVVEAAAAEIGHQALGVCGDVSQIDFHQRLAETVRRKFGAIDIYVANAGVISLEGSSRVTESEFDRHFDINARGVFFGVQAVAPLIRDGGNIIVTSSLAATKVLPQHTVYAGSKAALAAFARNWAIEFRNRGIRVNILSPGPVETEILGKLGVSDADRPGFEAHMADLIPAGRMGRPEELAEAALFLASKGTFVNGIELIVDGGMHLT
ncbi:NAD(P)-dependent dehydrogenase (short-subunit alcohol dehydrogenase family) [Rhizobium sp. BK650]|uniref:SDR family NAD(P)-dependent oxidoreductase n=1 Tax=Rhizobium sp. BK650 TaxID=2586990 RepID=UPI0016078EB3|nr:glucose 1-dehydrogenase [Rhizobium sp. BK650]MBB3659423.1 NAD(P)-dependent dehydrogenase (short-subunit alcohol dehydrogenase family) [Rhizobium sp. BK650]